MAFSQKLRNGSSRELPTSDGPLIHDAIGVPPHDEWMSPIGVFRSSFICRPK